MTRFEVEDKYISGYEIQTVGDVYHQEFWIPAEELSEFNRHIVGKIEIIRKYL